jgi:hypothetical protein
VPLLALLPIALVAMAYQVVSQLVQVFIRPIINHLNALDPDVALSPADAADGVIRGRWDSGTAYGQAASWGVSSTVFDMMVALVGEPPPLDEMRALWKRGVIDEATVEEMFKFSRAVDDFFPQWLLAAEETMSTADAIVCALKGVIPADSARVLFGQAGGMDEQWQWLLDATGDAIGVTEAAMLFNHQLITADQLKQVILHSRINPIFEPMAVLQRFHYLQVFQIAEALKNGTATPDQATSWMSQEGYPADQIAAFVGSASAAATGKAKNLAESQVTALYEAGAITGPQATAELADLGYQETEAQFILAVHDAQNAVRMTNAVVTKVRRDYVQGGSDAGEAASQLRELGFSESSIKQYQQLWDVEKSTTVKELTTSELGAAARQGAMTWTQLQTKLEDNGYSPEDAAILVFHYGGPPVVGSPAAG